MAAQLALGASAALVLAGCGGMSEEMGEVADALEQIADVANDDDQADEPDEQPADQSDLDGELELPVVAQSIELTVHSNGLEYTIDDLEVVDLDAEAGNDTRMQGAQLTFNGSAVNPSSGSANSSGMVYLQWQDEAGHSHQAMGQIDGATVPGGNASTPISLDITLNPEQLDTFDHGSAVVLFGTEGRSRAQLPLGSSELITRIPVQQAELVGQSFEVDGEVTVTIEEADLRWDIGGGVDDGQAILEIVVSKQNDTSGQVCWSRGEANNFTLLSASGVGTADLSMSDRGCTAAGQSHTSVTGIPVHEPFAGDYTITLDYSTTGVGSSQVPLEFTMLEEPAVPLSQR